MNSFNQDTQDKLKALVPDEDLCNEIPRGYFEDSALGWKCIRYPYGGFGWELVPSDGNDVDCPAPTLAEILVKLPKSLQLSWIEWDEYPGEWQIYCRTGKKSSPLACSDNPAAAALRLWLEINSKVTKHEEL